MNPIATGVFNFLIITLLGLLIAFSPMIVMVNLLVVLKSSRPILRTLIIMAGVIAPLLLVALLASVFLDPNAEISIRGVAQEINVPPLAELALGIWLLLVASKEWRKAKNHQGLKKGPPKILQHPPDKLLGLFSFAFVKSALSVTNLFAILVVAKLIITNSIDPPLAAAAYLWVLIVGLSPFAIILYFYFFKHEKLETLSGGVDGLFKRDVSFIMTIILAIMGVFFCLNGIFGALH